MWAAVIRILGPIANWIGKIILLPLIVDFIKQLQQRAEEKKERDKAHKEIEDGIKKIEDAITPEDQEAALDEFTRKARARRNPS